jgi:hypothetical protein
MILAAPDAKSFYASISGLFKIASQMLKGGHFGKRH